MPGAGPVTILLPNYNIYTEYGFGKFLDFSEANSRNERAPGDKTPADGLPAGLELEF
jgi:hypothetical protein